jgi:hypothetical protein
LRRRDERDERDERDGRVKLYIVFPRVDRAEENKTFEYGTSIVDV